MTHKHEFKNECCYSGKEFEKKNSFKTQVNETIMAVFKTPTK